MTYGTRDFYRSHLVWRKDVMVVLKREALRQLVANGLIVVIMLISAVAIFSYVGVFEQPRWLFDYCVTLMPGHSRELAQAIAAGALAFAAGVVGRICFHGDRGHLYWLYVLMTLSFSPILFSIANSYWYDSNFDDSFDWGEVGVLSIWFLGVPAFVTTGALLTSSFWKK